MSHCGEIVLELSKFLCHEQITRGQYIIPIQPSSGCKNLLQKCRIISDINCWISISFIVKGHETQNDNGKNI